MLFDNLGHLLTEISQTVKILFVTYISSSGSCSPADTLSSSSVSINKRKQMTYLQFAEHLSHLKWNIASLANKLSLAELAEMLTKKL